MPDEKVEGVWVSDQEARLIDRYEDLLKITSDRKIYMPYMSEASFRIFDKVMQAEWQRQCNNFIKKELEKTYGKVYEIQLSPGDLPNIEDTDVIEQIQKLYEEEAKAINNQHLETRESSIPYSSTTVPKKGKDI